MSGAMLSHCVSADENALLTGYDAASERYILKTSEGQMMISREEFFARLDDDLKVNVVRLSDTFNSCEIFWQDQGDIFVTGLQPGGAGDQLCVEQISIQDLASVYDSVKMKDKLIMTGILQTYMISYAKPERSRQAQEG